VPIKELPPSPDALVAAHWADIAPYYESLASEPLALENVEQWLAGWSRLDELVFEAASLAAIAFTCDTADPGKEEANLRFAAEIVPRVYEQQVRLARRLIESGYSRPDLEQVIKGFRADVEIFREDNVPLISQLEELGTEYEKITGGLTVDWDGQSKTIPQLQPYLKSRERAIRERAFRLGAGAYVARRDEMAGIFDRMYELRTRVAHNAGFANYQGYAFAAKHRFDYTPADCARFHSAVEQTVVPAVGRLQQYRRERLGVDTLRPWDLVVDIDKDEPLTPFADVDRFVGQAQRIFQRVDGELGGDFNTMVRESMLDLDSRQGKAPGGYCTTLHHRGLPYIFMNAVGVPDDVNTLIHEAGHCFHAFATRRYPLIWQRSATIEAAELASMSMELLAAPFFAEPDGYYANDDVRHAWMEHLEDTLVSLAHIASVDAFQSWIYTSGQGGDRDERDRAWLAIRSRFERHVDWSGLTAERVARWNRQLHIFLHPFYYIEYGIAQLGALQIWRQSLTDYKGAVASYRRALALGGTRPLPEIYAAAGAKLVFDSETMGELVALVEARIGELRSVSVEA